MSIVERGALTEGWGGIERAVAVPTVAARWYSQRNAFGGSATTLALAANILYGIPFSPPRDMTIDRLALNITSAAAGGKLYRIGIYQAKPTGLPDTLLAASGALAADATGILTYTCSVKLKAGRLYFFAVVSDGTPTVTATTGTVAPFGADDAADSGGGASVKRTFTYAALPNAWGTVASYVGPSPYVVARAV